jgi:DNA-binding beta-propeller fold protein YncE
LRELEHRYAREVAVVGIHSGKYTAERVTPRIQDAALRLGTAHPIVNDRQFRVWRSYAVRAWPTLVVVDPAGYVVGMHAGEFTSEMLAPFLDALIYASAAAGTLRRAPLDVTPGAPSVAPGTLRYPGKVALDPDDPRRAAVADSGHHRVLVGTLSDDGRRLRVERVVGGTAPGGDTAGDAGSRSALDGADVIDARGFDDGPSPRFASPQGLAFDGDTLYVADAENHAVRAIDLTRGSVRTVAGTGRRLRTRGDRDAGALASPWDLALAGRTLYVAMAGAHQLHAIDLATGRARVHAGQGGEDIRDGAHAEALLAQPMGIVHDGNGRLYFVDAETSAVRWADVDPAGAVHTLVGTGLFDFGDADGVGNAVRMQHQQGLALHPSGRLIVADSYNDALKWVDPATRRAETWRRGFHEPGGVAVGGGRVYVADTNAHRIVVVEGDGPVEEVDVVM